MNELVTISSHSRQVMIHLEDVLNIKTHGHGEEEPAVFLLLEWLKQRKGQKKYSCTELIAWLSEIIIVDEEIRFFLESLRIELMKDLRHSFPNSEERVVELEPQPYERLFRFLTILGTLVAICEGFDGIVSLLGLFPNVSLVIIFAAGIIFSIFAVIVFRGFNLVAISKNLDVEIQGSRQLIDVFLDQVDEIEKLRDLILVTDSTTSDRSLRTLLLNMVGMLKIRYEALDEAREAYKMALRAPFLVFTKSVMAAIAGILFFGGGFFSAQTLTLAVASLFSLSDVVVFWPVYITSIIVGFAALCIYYYVESPGFKNLVGRCFNVDEDKINALANEELVKEQRKGLDQLQDRVQHVERLHQEITGLMLFNDARNRPSFGRGTQTEGNGHPGFFHQRSRSLDNMSAVRRPIQIAQQDFEIQFHSGCILSNAQDPFDKWDGDFALGYQ